MVIYLLLLALPIILILYFQSLTQKSKKLHPPGPPPLPFIGNLHQFENRHTHLHRLSKQYGPIMFLKLGFRPVVVISSVAVVEEIMKSHDAVFSGRPGMFGLRRLSYNRMDMAFSTYNDVWREMRKISMTHLFSNKRVQSFRPIFREEVSKMMKKIAMDASSSKITDMSEMMMLFTSNTIGRVAFGKTVIDDECGKKRYFNLLHQISPFFTEFFVRDYLPSFGWIDRFSGMTAKLEKAFREMDCYCDELIKEHMHPNRPKSMEGDAIDSMLEILRNGSSSIDLTFNHIKALTMNIVAAGSEATAAGLEWALSALITMPLLMKKVQIEIRKLGGNQELLNEEDIEKLPYFRAVVKEIFRLFPPGPLNVPRETIEKCIINGYEIEAGTMVFFNAWAIGRDPEAWENADEFVPERFLNIDEDLRGTNPGLIPFGMGRRLCPGYGIGMAEIQLALVNLLYKFDWECPPGLNNQDIDLESQPGLVTHKKIPLCLVAKVVVA